MNTSNIIEETARLARFSSESFKSYVILFLFFFLFVFLPYANEKPRGIHQWAQSDRLAIAERFIEGRSIIDPATLSMKSDDGKVGVEFSGFQYLIAQPFKWGLNHDYLPFVYRFIIFISFFTTLFILTFGLLKDEAFWFKNAIFIGIFSSPILLYYGYNFLPDILALSLVLICLYLMHLNFEKCIYYILIISGLSLFIKTSSGIYFISFFAVYFFRNFRKWNKKLSFLLLLFVLISSGVAGYDYVLVSLRNKALYSYVFLSGTMLANSWAQFWEIFTTARRFLMEYFNGAQWFVLSIILIYNLANAERWLKKSNYILLSIFVLLGLSSIIVLFGVQYKDHDYYVLGTFMPIILFFTLKTIKQVASYIPPKTSLILAGIFAIVSFTQGSNRYFNRMSERVDINGTLEPYKRSWLIDADKKIKNIVPKDAWVYVVYVPEPNFSLVYLNRKGATFNKEEMGRDNSPFNWFIKEQKGQYVVCNQQFKSNFEHDQKAFLSKLEIAFEDDQFILYKVNGY